MADKPERGFGRGGPRGNRRGGRGGARGGPKKFGPQEELTSWEPLTKLGRLVKEQKVVNIETIFRFSMPIKEQQIVDFLLNQNPDKPLKEEVMQIIPVQKQTKAGQRTRFKAFVLIGDDEGHLGLGRKVAKEVQGAIKGAIIDAKLNMIPVRRGYWGNKIGKPHTIPLKCTGKSGSVRVRLIPAPRGSGIVGAPITKKILSFAGVQDCYTSSKGSTKTRGNLLKALMAALEKSFKFLTPDLWGKTPEDKALYEEHAATLQSFKK